MIPLFSSILHNLVSPHAKISPGLAKQKFATPPGTNIFPRSAPAGFQTLMPSRQPLYTLPFVSHLMPSGQREVAKAKTRRDVRIGEGSAGVAGEMVNA